MSRIITAVANSRLMLLNLFFFSEGGVKLLDNAFSKAKGVSLIIAFQQFTLHLSSVTPLRFLPPKARMLHALDLTPSEPGTYLHCY